MRLSAHCLLSINKYFYPRGRACPACTMRQQMGHVNAVAAAAFTASGFIAVSRHRSR